MNDEMNQPKMNRISTTNDNKNNGENDYENNTDEDDDIENQRSNSQNNVLHYEKQEVITNQSVLHRSLAECLKRLCKEMQNNSSNNNNSTLTMTSNEINAIHKPVGCNYSSPSSSITEITSTTFPVQALDLSMSSGTILNENVSSDSLKNITKIFTQTLSPSLSSFSSALSTPSMSSFSSNTVPQHDPQQYTVHFTNTNQNDSRMNSLNHTTLNGISYPYHQHHHQQSVCYDPLRIRYNGVTTTPVADNGTVIIPKMDSLLSHNLLLNTPVPTTTPNIQSNDSLTSNTLLFSGLPSTIFNLPSHLTYTNTTFPSKTSITDHCIKESEHVESKELFSKLSNVMNFHYNETFYNHLSLNSNEFYDSTTIMNNLLKPTNLIINNPINYSYNSNEAISTCTSLDETLIKEFDSELSLKPIDSCDTEQLDMKTGSLWLTELDMHSIPNLVESIKKYHSNDECGFDMCRSSKIREHYHCGICNKILLRREEMIRHAKWHRKREESMQHGFMRYSPCDDCTIASCPHNGRQTHYHCMQSNCDKVYVSTSDVQMHANYHRKDAIIIQEGFQRFRATENCGITKCPFFKEHTTHFHCRRNNCQFTFKNKADMEKHKLHHQKNDRFAQDGFRRYIKCENCDFPDCQYSGVINHIHCIRPGCDYVIHSSSQIISHKRKHDRRFTSISPRYMTMVCRDDLTQTTFSSSNQNNTDEDDDMLDTNKNKVDKNSLCTMVTRSDSIKTDECIMKQSIISELPLLQTKFNNTIYSDSKSESITINDLLNEVSKLYGVKLFLTNELCPDIKCPYYATHEEHYHCIKPRCYMATNRLDLMNIHRREFHQQINIENDFEYYDISIDCRRPICHNNKINKHFHCIYANCEYTFIRAGRPPKYAKHIHVPHMNLPEIFTIDNDYTIDLTYSMFFNQSIIDQNSIPSFLPLGLHSKHLPVLLPNTHKENLQNLSISMNDNIIKKECVMNSSTPVWSTATVDAEDSVNKESINLLSNIINECNSNISLPFNQQIKMYIPSDSQLPVSTGQNSVQV
ncbi:Transcription factor castor [Schistosoma japonicum]|uniref:Transcription factor castor n=1 Tax=Schistosoma japonicum TaxID=6182 RepID=A0A4Z2CVY6_SCHJA|nr:Transcription factor castor [Schistosoma japonicum]